ncbi:MAG: hypothetical protein M0P31_19275, partial [Solirubrobacteraceae bacterium]|nr:hypothetical protein [Solirubrobacteraceae bacterium]
TYDDVTRLQAEDPDEHAFGWYLPHRFAWRLEHVRPVLPPIPTIGRQGRYDVDDPEADHRG